MYCGPILALVLCGLQAPASAQPLPLQQALDQAFAHSPDLQVASARLSTAQGRLIGAQTYPYNPTLQGQAASRQDSQGRQGVDFQFSLSQQLELAGQRGKRVNAAQASLAAEQAQLQRAQRLVAARVHLAFVSALEARDFAAVAQRDMALTERLYDLAQRRLERGAGTQLDVNVAAAELGRAQASYQAANATYTGQSAALAEAIGLDPTSLPQPRGALQRALAPLPPLDQLVTSARDQRADLQTLRAQIQASLARHNLAQAAAWPNLTVRAFAGREDNTATLLGGSLAIPLPLFNRNQGPIAETRAQIAAVRAELAAQTLTVEREVISAHARYQASQRAAARLRDLVFGTLEQNIELLQHSFEAGKATWPEVVVIRRTLVEAQRELTAAEASTRRAWVELQLAAGHMPIPDTLSDEPEDN